MKSTFLASLVCIVLVLGFATFGNAQSESELISIEEVKRLCTQWAEEDGLEGDEVQQYIDNCIQEEMESIGLTPLGGGESDS